MDRSWYARHEQSILVGLHQQAQAEVALPGATFYFLTMAFVPLALAYALTWDAASRGRERAPDLGWTRRKVQGS